MAKKKKKELTMEELLEEALVKEEDWPYEVPGNWVWTRLGSIAEYIQRGKSPKYSDIEQYPVISQKCIQWSGFDPGIVRFINLESIRAYGEDRFIQKGDILWNSTGTGTIGRLNIYNDELKKFEKVVADSHVTVVRVKNLCKKYVYYYLTSPRIQGDIENRATGTTNQIELNTSTIVKQLIPLPPLAEQQRIVDRIESLFEKLDQAKELIQEALDSFENSKAAILHKAFTGELTKKWRDVNGVGMESWEETKSKSIFEYVTSGSRGWAQYYDTSGSIFIRMGNLDHGTIELDLANIQYVNLPEMVEGKRSKVEKNDVLISITADVGMVGLVRNENMVAYINQHVALARPVKSVDAEFIAWFLVSDLGLRQLQTLQRGATKIGLTLGDIRNLIIKLPCLSEQQEIVRILDDLFEKEQNAKDLCDLIDQIEAMKKTILGQAFRGQLGTNDPGDIDALVLLKRILTKE